MTMTEERAPDEVRVPDEAPVPARSAEQVRELAGWVVRHGSPSAPAAGEAHDRALDAVLANVLAVTAGGAATADHAALVAAWDPEPGLAHLVGTGRTAAAEAAAWLNGVAGVRLERDEGNRAAKGHPAAQAYPAVLALAERLDADAATTLRALAVAYEVAARAGRATTLDADAHPHGTWGVLGGAAGAAVLLGLDAPGVTTVLETAAALPVATSWGPVLAGSAVRDEWMGAVAVAGLAAARAGAARPGEPARGALSDGRLGGALGAIDLDLLVADLPEAPGDDRLVLHGYLKRHSSCAFTHSPADAALGLRAALAERGLTPVDVETLEVTVTGPARTLDAPTWSTPHGAYFSVPFAVASALVHGDVAPHRSQASGAAALADVASRVHVLDGGPVPTDGTRPARLVAHLRPAPGGADTAHPATLVVDVPHPRGDGDLTPLDDAERDALLDAALEGSRLTGADVLAVVADLRAGVPVRGALARLAATAAPTPDVKEQHR